MKFILDLLTEGYILNEEVLYAALNKTPKGFTDRSVNSKGLGKIFQKATRKNYKGTANVLNAFMIDDRGKGRARIKNLDGIQNLYLLAQVFRTGDKKQGINANQRKYAMCLAVIINVMGKNVEPTIVDELAAVYSGGWANLFANDEFKAIKTKLAQKLQLLAQPITVVTKLLFEMSNIKIPGGITKNQGAQQAFFKTKIKALTAEALTNLCRYMARVEDMEPGEDIYFTVVRQEFSILFGNGNTPTWQTMFTAARSELLAKLGAPTTVIGKLLADMSKINAPDELKKTKEAQQAFFSRNITALTAEQLTSLCTYMGLAQDLHGLGVKNSHFADIREERYSLFGGGNTSTWQSMFTAAKSELLVKLGAPAPSSEAAKAPVKKEELIELSAEKFTEINNLMSKQSGRWYATLFATNSSTFFNERFKIAESKTRNQLQPESSKTTLPAPLRTMPTVH